MQDLADEGSSFLDHRSLEFLVILRIEIAIRLHFTNMLDVQPLPDKVLDESFRSWVRQQTIHLTSQLVFARKTPLRSELKQLSIGCRPPKEVRQSVGEGEGVRRVA